MHAEKDGTCTKTESCSTYTVVVLMVPGHHLLVISSTAACSALSEKLCMDC